MNSTRSVKKIIKAGTYKQEFTSKVILYRNLYNNLKKEQVSVDPTMVPMVEFRVEISFLFFTQSYHLSPAPFPYRQF